MIPEYLARALMASVMIGLLLGLLSPLINMKGLAFLTHATFHSLLFGAVLGMIIGLLTGEMGVMIWTALIITVFAVIVIAYLEYKGLGNDTAVGIVSSIVAGLTVLSFGVLYKVMASRPYVAVSQSIVAYLTGEVFLLSINDLLGLMFGGLLILFLLLIMYRDLLYVSFDPEGVESYGGNVRAYLILLYIIVGSIGALVVKTVGLITLQVIAVLPGAIALMKGKNLKSIMALSLGITIGVETVSIILAYFIDIPPSGIATIILGTMYGVFTFKK